MSSSPEQDPLVGTVLADRYKIRSPLSRGGCGQVYLAEHVMIDRMLAVKVMTGEQPGLADETGRRRFLQEARATSKIDHPHVIDIIDFGYTPDGVAYYVMEYLSGEDLAALLRREGPIPWPRLAPILIQICSALAAAHRHGIIHRDIKPANCFRTTVEDDTDFIKVLDFGIAKLHTPREQRSDLPETASHVLLGTPAYMAPELASGGAATVRSDIYSLGILMYELATGRRPFTGANFLETFFQHAYSEPMAPSAKLPELEGEVDRIILKAIAKDPQQRYAEMRELHADIKASLALPPKLFPPAPLRVSDAFVHATTDAIPVDHAPAPPPAVHDPPPAPPLRPPPAETPQSSSTPPSPPVEVALTPETVTLMRERPRSARPAVFGILLTLASLALLIVILSKLTAGGDQPTRPNDRTSAPVVTPTTAIDPKPTPQPTPPAKSPATPTPVAPPPLAKDPPETKPEAPKKFTSKKDTLEKPRKPEDPPPLSVHKTEFSPERARARLAAKLATAEAECFESYPPPQGFEFDVEIVVSPDGFVAAKAKTISPLRACLVKTMTDKLNVGATVQGGEFIYTFKPK